MYRIAASHVGNPSGVGLTSFIALQMEASVKEAERTAIPVSQVVDLIYEAATTPNPKSKYHIGDNAAISHWAKRLLPDAVWESIVSKKLADGTSPAESLLTQKTEAARQREQAM